MNKTALMYLLCIVLAAGTANAQRRAARGVNFALEEVESLINTRNSVLPVNFNKDQYREQRLPGYWSCYASFRNELQPRPLFIAGVNTNGVINFHFDTDEGRREQVKVTASGEGTAVLRLYGSKREMLDASGYACAEWVSTRPHPQVFVTFSNLRDLEFDNKELLALLNPLRRPDERGRLPRPAVNMKGVFDLELRVGGNRLRIPELPLTLTIQDVTTYWDTRLYFSTVFKGSDIGLSGNDAGEIRMRFHGQAFSQVPMAQQKSGAAVDKQMSLDELLEQSDADVLFF